MVRHFDHLDQPRIGVDAHGLHAGGFELLQIVVVELVAVTVTLRNIELSVGRSDLRTLLQRTGIGAQTHRAALGRHALLLLHQVDDRMRRRFHFARIGVGDAQHVAGELDHGALHAQTDAEERNVVFAGITHGHDLALDAAVSEARSHQNARHLAQLLGHGFGRDLL